MPNTRIRRLRYAPTPDGFLAWKKQAGQRFSEGTEKKYLPAIEHYVAFAELADVPLEEQDATFVEMEYLPQADAVFEEKFGRRPSASYKRNRYVALKAYFDFLSRLGAVATNPLAIVVAPTPIVGEIDWLATEEDAALANVEKDPLEEVLWALARCAGLRVSEIRNLREEDVDLVNREVHIRAGKTRAAKRDVTMLPPLVVAVDRWRRARAELYPASAAEGPFVRTRSGSISTVYIDVILKRTAARAGVRLHGRDENGAPVAVGKAGKNVSEVSAHTLRRTFGSDLLNRGVPLEVVSEQLGHASTKVTSDYYARLTKKTQREAVLRSVDVGVASPDATLQRLRSRAEALISGDRGSTDEKLRDIEALEAALQHCRETLLAA